MTEPFCWPPETVARLTDWQVIQVRKRQIEKTRAASRPADTPDGPETALVGPDEDRAARVAALAEVGIGPEAAARLLDRMEREHGA